MEHFATTDRRKYCALSGKAKDKIPKLIIGLHGAVCSEFVDLANAILMNELGATGSLDRPNPDYVNLQQIVDNLKNANPIIKIRCPKCKVLNDEDANFCKDCGHRLD